MKTPVTFTQKVADRICAELSKGRSLRSTCTDEGMPAPSTVLDWCEVHPEFGEQYARARLRGYSLLADEIIDISDEAEFEPVPGQDGEDPREVRVDATAVARNRLRVDSRKWMLSKMLPKVYGDKTQTEISGPDGGPVQVQAVEWTVRDPAAPGT